MVTDDLDRVFVSTNSTVAAETPELAFDRAFSCCVGSFLLFKREVCNVVADAESELSLGCILCKLVIYCEDA